MFTVDGRLHQRTPEYMSHSGLIRQWYNTQMMCEYNLTSSKVNMKMVLLDWKKFTWDIR